MQRPLTGQPSTIDSIFRKRRRSLNMFESEHVVFSASRRSTSARGSIVARRFRPSQTVCARGILEVIDAKEPDVYSVSRRVKCKLHAVFDGPANGGRCLLDCRVYIRLRGPFLRGQHPERAPQMQEIRLGSCEISVTLMQAFNDAVELRRRFKYGDGFCVEQRPQPRFGDGIRILNHVASSAKGHWKS